MEVAVEGEPQGAVDVKVQGRQVRLVPPQREHPVADPPDVRRQHLTIAAHLALDVVDQPVRQGRSAPEDHLVDVVVRLVAALGEDPDRAKVHTGVPVVADHLGHGHPPGPRDCVEQRLGDAEPDGAVQRSAVDLERVDLPGHVRGTTAARARRAGARPPG